jgi:hypothetical protein
MRCQTKADAIGKGRMGDIDVPEIGSELWHLPSDSQRRSIPLDEFGRCKTVADNDLPMGKKNGE